MPPPSGATALVARPPQAGRVHKGPPVTCIPADQDIQGRVLAPTFDTAQILGVDVNAFGKLLLSIPLEPPQALEPLSEQRPFIHGLLSSC